VEFKTGCSLPAMPAIRKCYQTYKSEFNMNSQCAATRQSWVLFARRTILDGQTLITFFMYLGVNF